LIVAQAGLGILAPGKANDKSKNQRTGTNAKKGDISNEVRKGTFLKSFDSGDLGG
jgi:hypothetical protein